MKSQRLRKLQIGTAIAIVLYLMLVTYMFLAMPFSPKWNNAVVERRIQSAASMQELQTDLRSAVSSLSTYRHSSLQLQLLCLVASIGTVGFLGWSLFMMGRVKREDLSDRAV